MLMAVSFDPVELVNQMLRPRFHNHGHEGCSEGGPSLWANSAGSFFISFLRWQGRSSRPPPALRVSQKAVVVFGFLFTLFYAFASGTRNVFCVYLVTFVVAYILLRPNITWKRMFVLCCLAAGLLFFAAYYMLQFRDVGLESYVERDGERSGL